MAMTAMAVMTAVSTLVSVAGTIYQGNAAENAAEKQAELTSMQGEMDSLNARSQAAEMQNEATRLKAKQVTQGAASGVSLDSGSFLSLVSSSASKAEQDRQQVLRTGATSLAAGKSEASQIKAAGSVAKTGSYFSATGSLLKGASQTMSYGSQAGWFD